MMDQKAIMEGLTRALSQGTGDLDDLENLLKRAQADIEVARQGKPKLRLKQRSVQRRIRPNALMI